VRRKIPSTAALIAFEAAARHQSFTRAADELALTQSAVCRQIAGLESFLGIELFRRTRRGVLLTEAGLFYSRQVAQHLDAAERDALAVMGKHGSGRLELAVVPTFGTQWLLPRLKRFQVLHPDITVNLTNRTRPFLFADTDFDAALYCGDGEWSGTQTHFLMHEYPVPVCSPALVDHKDGITAQAVAALPLLQQTTRPYAWRQWFNAQGLSFLHDLHGPRYELFSMLAQAAIHEMGVALIPPFLIQNELEQERLIILNTSSYRSDRAYYLAIPERTTTSQALQSLRDWLLGEAQEYRTGSLLSEHGVEEPVQQP